MFKKFIIILLILSTSTFAKIIVKVNEPIRFKDINSSELGNIVTGEGIVEIFTDNLEEDLGKKVILRFPTDGLMTNSKKWLIVDKYMIDEGDREIEIIQERRRVKIYAILKKTQIDDKTYTAEQLEGEYVGYAPIIVEVYGRLVKELENNYESSEEQQ
ncbi:hypothetical protein [uncultured Fusobacterium sp.]|uniref:hypothetical protein n=1 Tax=uncultured Fusobacterium sp. TaxID=159267 RepID=UPI0025D6E8AA|nr:hypothetical protein [uncultured Fusobacterium sp.]